MRILILFILFLFICPIYGLALTNDGYGGAASEGARDTVQRDVVETLNRARETYDNMGRVTYDESIPEPEDIQSAANDCLDGILSADFGFGLGTPSVSKLFNSACKTINSEVKGHLEDVNYQLTDEYGRIGAGLGRHSAPTNQVDYKQVADGIADELWNDISGDNSW